MLGYSFLFNENDGADRLGWIEYAGGMETDSSAYLCPGVIGSSNPNVGEGMAINYNDWNRVDVLIRINASTNTYFPVYYINGSEKVLESGEKSELSDPFYAFVISV